MALEELMSETTEEEMAEAPETDLAPETVNLVSTLKEEFLEKLGNKVVENFDRDWKSSAKFRERRANQLRLFAGIMPDVDADSGLGSSQIHYPIIAVAVTRIASRIYDQQFPANGEFFGFKPTDITDVERTIRLGKHLNWQVTHQMPEYIPNHDVGIMQWLIYGDAFSYVCYDRNKKRNSHKFPGTEDVVISYTARDTDPSMSNVRRITLILRKYRHELEDDEEAGYYAGVADLYDEDIADEDGNTSPRQVDSSDTKSAPISEVVDEIAGQDKPADYDLDAPRVLYEQHTWLKLPKEKRERPVIIVVDKETSKVLSVTLREDEDPADRARYNREKSANDAVYAAQMQQFEVDMADYQAAQFASVDATQMDPSVPVAPPDPAVVPQMPPAPEEPEQPRMVPIHRFTHYGCIPNPEGFYNFGIGSLLEGHNMFADTVASQIVDAGTLANTATFLYSYMAKLKRGELKIRPGQGTEVELTPDQLDKAFKVITFPPPNPAMGQLVKDQKEEAEALSGANEILSGEVGGSNETATTTRIRIGEAVRQIQILNKRYTRARTSEGQKIARLNSVYLSDEEYFSVIDPGKSTPQAPAIDTMSVSRMDYLMDTDITITADLSLASQALRIQDATDALGLVSANPSLAANPALIMACAKNLFVAMDRPDLVTALETPLPPPPMMPPGGGPIGQPGEVPGPTEGGPPSVSPGPNNAGPPKNPEGA